MKTSVILFFLTAGVAIESRSLIYNSGCKVSVDHLEGDLKEPQPLILKDDNKLSFVLPKQGSFIILPKNESVVFACPGKKNGLPNFDLEKSVKAVCAGGKKFRVDQKSHNVSDFYCKVLPVEVIKKSKVPCLKKHQKYEIGYSVDSIYLPVLTICRDEETLRTLYSKAKLVKELLGYQHKFPRPVWKSGFYYPGYDMKEIYKGASQVKTVEHILGSKKLAEKYLRLNQSQFLHRGHLAAKADFVFGAHQMATFWLLNTAPQWASFNMGNWMVVESNVRNYSTNRKIDLDMYTGVHGITTLKDTDGNEQPLYLHSNTTHSAFPVPRYFWKIVHDPISKRGLAIVGLNEPYAKKITQDMYICPDMVGQKEVEWVKAEFDSIEKGITYVCTVDSLRKAVPTIPEFEVSGILS